jgi:dolichol-phosphate mannosyltransferase
MLKIILTLPAKDEAPNVGPLLVEAGRVFASLDMKSEIVLVDDGSVDGTAQAARAAGIAIPLTIVSHPQNLGLGRAILTGLREALRRVESDDDLVICMDCDNTHPPETIRAMASHVDEGYDLVIASRYRRGSRQRGVPWSRRLLSYGARWVFWWFLRLEGVRDYTCGFRAYRAGLLRRAFEKHGDRLITRQGFACTDELLVRLAEFDPRILEVPFELRYDHKQGRSKIQLLKTIKETLKMLWGR